MTLARQMSSTSAHREAVLLRLVVAADLLLDGARAVRWHFLIGTSRLDEMTKLGDSTVAAIGYLQIGLAGLVLLGLFTRVTVVPTLVLATLSAMSAWARVKSLGAEEMLDATIRHGAVALTALALFLRGAGPLSADAILHRRRGRRR